MHHGRGIGVSGLAWATGLVPLVVVHACYLWSATAGLVPWCFPYLEGCTSISRASRQGDVVYFFRAAMLPYSALLALYWALVALWLRELLPAAATRRRTLAALGIIGALFLVVYVTFLGVEGDASRWLRRYGTTVHFSFTALAQILLMSLLLREPRVPAWIRRAKLGLCLGMLGLGLLSIPARFFVDPGAAEDAIEWSYWLLAVSYFPLTGLAWRATGFRLDAFVAGPGSTR